MLEGEPKAQLEPWCFGELAGARCLFGFATQHNMLGGLSWVRSSPIVEIDETMGRARTYSGRLYRLGKKITPAEFDEEASAAFRQLFRKSKNKTDRRTAIWLTCCKMGRWLNLTPPPRKDILGLEQFMQTHEDAYLRARQSFFTP